MTPEAIANFSIGDAFGASVLGFAIVFFVLVVLLFMIKIMRGVVEGMAAGEAAPAAAVVAAPASAAPAANPNMVPAKGSLGEVKLYDVEDKTAAMLMAIVADELKAPLNELRFISIREKK